MCSVAGDRPLSAVLNPAPQIDGGVNRPPEF
jgi:hypothetical protein